jgi:hypothetical protein
MFRFTIRELFMLTLVVALGIGWGLRDRQLQVETKGWKTKANALAGAIESRGSTVIWGEEQVSIMDSTGLQVSAYLYER